MLVQRAATASSSRPICSTDACSPPIDVLAESLIVGDVLMSLMTFGETVLVWSAVKAWSAMAASNGSTVSGGPSGKNSVIGRVPISFTLRRGGCCHRVEDLVGAEGTFVAWRVSSAEALTLRVSVRVFLCASRL